MLGVPIKSDILDHSSWPKLHDKLSSDFQKYSSWSVDVQLAKFGCVFVYFEFHNQPYFLNERVLKGRVHGFEVEHI